MILLSTKKFEIFTNTGRKDYPESYSSKDLCKVQTSTGNITIRIKKGAVKKWITEKVLYFNTVFYYVSKNEKRVRYQKIKNSSSGIINL